MPPRLLMSRTSSSDVPARKFLSELRIEPGVWVGQGDGAERIGNYLRRIVDEVFCLDLEGASDVCKASRVK